MYWELSTWVGSYLFLGAEWSGTPRQQHVCEKCGLQGELLGKYNVFLCGFKITPLIIQQQPIKIILNFHAIFLFFANTRKTHAFLVATYNICISFSAIFCSYFADSCTQDIRAQIYIYIYLIALFQHKSHYYRSIRSCASASTTSLNIRPIHLLSFA